MCERHNLQKNVGVKCIKSIIWIKVFAIIFAEQNWKFLVNKYCEGMVKRKLKYPELLLRADIITECGEYCTFCIMGQLIYVKSVN